MIVELKVEPIEQDISIKIDEVVTEGGSALPWYEGEYSVEPQFEKIVLNTKNKSMRDDVEVLEIPVSEVGNDYGTTLIIGGK